MHVTHLLIGLGGGGAEHLVLELADRGQHDIDTTVSVVYITDNEKIKFKFDELGIETIPLGIKSYRNIIGGLKKYYHYLKEHKNTVVHAHMFHALMVTLIFKPVISHKIVFTLHTNFVKQWYRKTLLFLSRPFRSADVIFSSKSKKWYQKSDSVVIANGIDVTKFTSALIKQDIFTCLFLGRLDEPKNPLYLIDLINKLKEKNNFKILVVGDGKFKNILLSQIEEYNLDPYIELLGFRKDIPQILSQSSCLITPSLWEGMPISILEAGACGLPIISTPVGSIPDILNNNNAYLADIANFHTAVNDVMNDYPQALKKAKNFQREVLEDYNIDICYLKYRNLYFK